MAANDESDRTDDGTTRTRQESREQTSETSAGRRPGERGERATLTRREFAGAAALAAAAVDPAAAAEGRDRPLQRAGEVADLPGVEEAFTPSEWHVVGPFQYQRRGVETGWLFPNGGEPAYADGDRTPGDERFQSAIAGGATVEWAERSLAEGETTVPLDLADRVDPTGGDLTPLTGNSGLFDDFQDWFGAGGVLYGTSYAVAAFEVAETKRAVLETDASVAWLNGQRYEEGPTGVVLQAGANYLLLKTTVTLGAGSVSVSFRPPRAPVEVDALAAFRGTPQNAVLPDLRAGERTDRPASIRVTNTTAEPVPEATLEFGADSDLLVGQTVDVDPPLAPFETRRINTRVKTKGPVDPEAARRGPRATDEEEMPDDAMAATMVDGAAVDPGGDAETTSFDVEAADVSTMATVTVGGESDSRTIPLRVRSPDEPKFQTTFVSEHDGSVQEFSVREPTNPDSGGPFELIVTLHGANVPSINQAGGGYSQKEDTYILAPGARGPVNYDHEDLGRLDDLEALRVMKERYPIDEDSVYLTGHSMGGHGTWHVGLTNPDRFAGLAPSAGWTDHETYLTTTFARDKLHTYPGLKAVKETSLQKNLALPKTENAADGTLPVFALHGGQDQSVPTLHPRTYVRALANRGLTVQGEVGRRYSNPDPDAVDAALLEVPGMGHWWDDDIGPGTDTVNHPDLMSFLRSTERDPYPEQVRFFTTNLAVEHRKFWVAVYRQHTVHAPTRVVATVEADGIHLDLENVAVLGIDPAIFFETGATPQLHVDGETARVPGRGRSTVYADLRDGVEVGTSWHDDPTKGPDQYGPMQHVHHDPYRLVYGTAGSDAETARNRNLANVRSQRLVQRARAPATVVPDTAVDRQTMKNFNLVLFGRPSSNEVLADLQAELPIHVGDGVVHVGERAYHGDLGVEYVHPNPEETDNLVQVETGTSLAGLSLTRVRNWIPTQTPTADYQVYDGSIRFQGWNACLAAGFFDADWELDEELGFLRETA